MALTNSHKALRLNTATFRAKGDLRNSKRLQDKLSAVHGELQMQRRELDGEKVKQQRSVALLDNLKMQQQQILLLRKSPVCLRACVCVCGCVNVCILL